MAEIPILMNEFSMKETLAGRKTQTRRVIRPQPEFGKHWKHGWIVDPDEMDIPTAYCPYGIQGDFLWARETWCGHWGPILDGMREPGRSLTGSIEIPQQNGGVSLATVDNPLHLYYRATWGDEPPLSHIKWRPGIYMFKWACREWLVNEGSKVERVQDISEEDAEAEGCASIVARRIGHRSAYGPREEFGELWDSINAKPRPVVRKGKVVSYVSFPWEEIRETREYRGKPWEIWGNPFCWCVRYNLLTL